MSVLRASYERRWTISTVRNALLTSFALDSLGTILADYKFEERVEWLAGDRTSYPKCRRGRRTGFNTEFSALVLAVLIQTMPVDYRDASEFGGELAIALNSYYAAVVAPHSTNRYVRTVAGDRDTGLAMPLGMTLGMYTAAIGSNRALLRALTDEACRRTNLTRRDADDVLMYALLAAILAKDGYCGQHIIQTLKAHKAVPYFMRSIFTELSDNRTNVDYLSSLYIPKDCLCLTIAEECLAETFLYMMRVDTCYPRNVLPSGPKDQLPDVFASVANKLSDVAYVYGGVCTLSEQNYSLVTKPLRESVAPRRLVEDFLRYAC